MPIKDLFKVISVTGAHSGVGKTTLCSILLKELKGFGAIKFTKTAMYTSVVEDMGKLNKKGKDTAILLESGAEKVIWIQSPPHELMETLEVAISKMADFKGVIVEGNSPVDFLNPDLVIFIIGQKEIIKPSALKVGKRADIVIVNSEKPVSDSTFLSSILPKNAKIFRINLANKKGDIGGFLSCVKAKIVGDSH